MFDAKLWFGILFVMVFFSVAVKAGAGSAIVVGAVDCSGISCELRDGKLDGKIDSTTADKVRRLIKDTKESATRYKKEPSFVWPVELDSPGGDVEAAMEIGRIFRKERVWVLLPTSAVCFSACVLVLAGSVNRLIFGKVGIHRPYLEVPRQEVSLSL